MLLFSPYNLQIRRKLFELNENTRIQKQCCTRFFTLKVPVYFYKRSGRGRASRSKKLFILSRHVIRFHENLQLLKELFPECPYPFENL